MECFAQILSIAAMTTITPPFLPHCTTKHRFTATEGDHLTLLNIYTAFTTVGKKSSTWCHNNQLNFKALQRAVSVRGQLWRYLERFYPDLEKRDCKGADGETVRRCVASGLFAHAARMQPDGTFRLVGGGEEVLWAHPSSVLFSRKADWCVFGEVVEMRGKKYIRDVGFSPGCCTAGVFFWERCADCSRSRLSRRDGSRKLLRSIIRSRNRGSSCSDRRVMDRRSELVCGRLYNTLPQ